MGGQPVPFYNEIEKNETEKGDWQERTRPLNR